MAEILIRAKGHWKDGIKKADYNALSEEEKIAYDARTQLGDIIVVRPDGWVWGSAEGLPDFVRVTVTGMTVEEAKQYEDSINEQYTDAQGNPSTRMLRFRKFFLKPTWVNTIISQGGTYTIDKETVVDYIEQKVL